jgi:uncharacterized protein
VNCQEAGKLLHAYVDGQLELASALGIEDHMRDCPRCQVREAGLRAMRTAVRRHTEFQAAPATLRQSLRNRYGSASPERVRPPRSYAAVAAVLATFLLVAALGWSGGKGNDADRPGHAAKIVYHISQSDTARAALRNLANHLEASPDVKVVVVAHNSGVDFLLRGARDASGEPYDAAVRKFVARGVEFRVCSNTLVRRNMGAESVLPDAKLVPSGIAEIGRLQSEENYAYMRL